MRCVFETCVSTIVPTLAVPAEGVVAMDTSAPEIEVQPSGSSSTLVHIVDVEPVLESMPPPPPPPAKRETVLGPPAPSVIPAAIPKSRKRPGANPDEAKKTRYTKDSEARPSSSKACGSGLVSRQHVKFVLSIEGMISESRIRVERLAKEFASHEKVFTAAGSLKVIEGGSFPQSQEWGGIGGLVSRRQRKLSRIEFGPDMARIASLDTWLSFISGTWLWRPRRKDGEVQLFLGEMPPSPRAEEAKLLAHKAELADEEGDLDQILAVLNSECTLLPC
ncbi:hypothetical protein Bca52824_016079 [Brassica carinata]|uniref:Uncharacterized protein n=1 Tax=Brassica carinata TaxID=52824 RepID=A0A8X7W384_BRACI|nr:hypothetical protein Bca52824_016079 [Brassica carinata]